MRLIKNDVEVHVFNLLVLCTLILKVIPIRYYYVLHEKVVCGFLFYVGSRHFALIRNAKRVLYVRQKDY